MRALGLMKRMQQALRHRRQRSIEFRGPGLRALQRHGHHTLHLEAVVQGLRIELGAQREDDVGVGHTGQLGGVVVELERRQNLRRVVHEVDDEGLVFAGVTAVQTRQRLHGLNAAEPLVHVHRAQQRLVEPGLELVGHQQDAVVAALEGGANVLPVQPRVQRLAAFGERVGPGFQIDDFARERHQRVDLVAMLGDVFANGLLPAHRFFAAAGHDHRLRLAFQQTGHVLAKVLDHELNTLRDVVLMQAHPAHDAFHGL